MTIKESIKKYRTVITILLALAGIGLMIYYDYCDTACSYLRGDIWGFDLKWIGIAYMMVIIIFAALNQTQIVRIFLAAGLGVEVFLFSFQVKNNVFCPFCLAFAVMVIAAFIVNYEASPSWHQNQRKMWLYFLGEVNFPMLKINRLSLLVVALAGYFFILFTFSGLALPAYAQDKETVIPSLGKGSYEVLMFSNYFCPPCRRIDTKAKPLLKELLATGKVKITFIDVPFNKNTPIYAQIYLYAINAGATSEEVLRIRKTLFTAAQVKHIQSQDTLINYLKEEKIVGKQLDIKPVFTAWGNLIKKYNVRQTPTCFVKYSEKDTKKYVGDIEIWDGLTKFKNHLQKAN